MPGVYIPPPVPNEEALFKIDAVAFRGLQNEAWPRFPAIAAVPVIVIADEAIVNRQAVAEVIVHRLYGLTILTAASDVGLVGNQNEEIIRQMKLRERPFRVGREFHLTDVFRRIRFAVPDGGTDDNPVTV